MEVLSVNIGKARRADTAAGIADTGIYKVPVAGRARISKLGLEGDFIGDLKVHGGSDQAVYVYGTRDYDWWTGELGRRLEAGAFGENLTIGELASVEFSVGDRLRLGSAILEVTAPRFPCATLAARMGDPLFVKRFSQAERPGLYCRVIQEGIVAAGDRVLVEPAGREAVTILEICRQHYRRNKDAAVLRRFLEAPISARERASIERALQKQLRRGKEGEADYVST